MVSIAAVAVAAVVVDVAAAVVCCYWFVVGFIACCLHMQSRRELAKKLEEVNAHMDQQVRNYVPPS